MTKSRTSLEYQRGVDEFLEHTAQNAGMGNRIYCPCVRCGNKSLQFVKDVKGHLYFKALTVVTKSGFGMGRVLALPHQ